MSTLNRIFTESSSLADYAERYAAYVSDLMARLDFAAIERVGGRLEAARRAGRTIFLIGNGGSAATASHFANDLALGPRVYGARAYRAISLTDNCALLTAAGNDLGYETIFLEQLKTLLQPKDVVIAISASGNSPNVLRAIEYANQRGAITIGLTGFDGGTLRQIVTEHLHVSTPHGDYGPVEDLHLILNHLITSYLVRLGSEKTNVRDVMVVKPPARALGPVAVRAEPA